MISGFLNITVISEWVALIAALFFLNKTTIWRWFIIILIVTILTEFTAWYTTSILKKSNNFWIYNIYDLINGVFCIWIFTKAEPLLKSRMKLYICLALFLGFCFFNLLFFQGINVYNDRNEVFGDILLAIISCYFFYNLLKEENYRNLLKYEYFWYANGILFSSLGSVVLYLFIDYLWAFYKHTHVNIYGYINYGLNVLLYSCFIIAFICRNRNTKLLQA